MRFRHILGAVAVLMAISAANHGRAQNTPLGSPSMLTQPSYSPNDRYPLTSTWQQPPMLPPPGAANVPGPGRQYGGDPGITQSLDEGIIKTDSSCHDCGQISCGCGCWYGYLGALYMNRDDENPVWLSFDTSNVGSALLGSRDADMRWSSGVDGRIGRLMGCGVAFELGYWGIYPSVTEANAYDPDGVPLTAADLNTTFAFQSLDYNGSAVVGWFDNAARHRLRRSYGFHNVEANLVGNSGCWSGGDCGMRFGWIGGFRYFRFDDGFDFASDASDGIFTGAVDEVYYTIDVVNHLIGAQVGGVVDYRLCKRLGFFSEAKMGIFVNHIDHSSFIGGSAGPAVVNDATSPYDGQPFDIDSTKDDLAFLAELNFGGRFYFTPRWALRAGYRAAAITGVALSPNQIPMNFGDLSGVASIDSNGSLIVHGGYAALEFTY